MATIRMSGGQTFAVNETYEDLRDLTSGGWTGTTVVTDSSTAVVFTVKVPAIVSVQP